MPKGASRRWRQLAPHTQEAIPWLNAAMTQGYDVECAISGVASSDRAGYLKRGLFRAAAIQKVSVHVHVRRQKNGTYTLLYAVHSKTAGRAHILAKHGNDPAQWPYDPRRPAPRDDAGNRTDT